MTSAYLFYLLPPFKSLSLRSPVDRIIGSDFGVLPPPDLFKQARIEERLRGCAGVEDRHYSPVNCVYMTLSSWLTDLSLVSFADRIWR
jgi:hypothetical protein